MLAFVAEDGPEFGLARDRLAQRYRNCHLDRSEVVVVVGGNSALVRALHQPWAQGRRLFASNPHGAGFLTHGCVLDDLPERLEAAHALVISPLRARIYSESGPRDLLAFNEVALFRQGRRMSRTAVAVDGTLRLPALEGDGVLVATPFGSTAYNLSAHGAVLPIGSGMLAVTPIAPFRPRRWPGAIVSDEASIRLQVLEPTTRPTSVTADVAEVREVWNVDVSLDRSICATLLYDSQLPLAERQLREQFEA